LLDLAHLHPGKDSPAYLQGLRLQNLDRLNPDKLQQMAERAGKPKLRRAAACVAELARAEAEECEIL